MGLEMDLTLERGRTKGTAGVSHAGVLVEALRLFDVRNKGVPRLEQLLTGETAIIKDARICILILGVLLRVVQVDVVRNSVVVSVGIVTERANNVNLTFWSICHGGVG